MGIDLKILASNFREHGGELCATAKIRFDRDGRVLALFSREATPCVVRPLPDGLKIVHEEQDGLKQDDKDRYGEPLTFTTSELLDELPAIEDISQWNRAVLAFLFSLPPETKIVLYWC
jgi:hypothetical protein